MIIPQCKLCDLCLHNNFTPQHPIGNPHSAILILVDSYKPKHISVIKSGMNVAGFTEDDYYITAIVKCKPKGEIRDYTRVKCARWFNVERAYPYKLVMLFGYYPYHTYFRGAAPTSFHNARNQILHIQNKYIFTAHSPALTYFQSNYEEFALIFERVDAVYKAVIDYSHINNVDRFTHFQPYIR